MYYALRTRYKLAPPNGGSFDGEQAGVVVGQKGKKCC